MFPYFLLFAEGAAASPTNQPSEASIPRSVGSDDQGVEAGDEGEGKGEEEERQEEVGIEDQIDGNDDEVISDDFLSSSSSLSSPPPSPPRCPSTASEEDEGELYFMHAPDWVLHHSILLYKQRERLGGTCRSYACGTFCPVLSPHSARLVTQHVGARVTALMCDGVWRHP